MPHITIDDVVIELERKKVKNLRLAVYAPEGRVRVAAPMRMPDKIIQAFIISKMPWIKKHLAKAPSGPVPQEVLSPEAQRVMDKLNRNKLNLILPDLIHKWQTIIGVEAAESEFTRKFQLAGGDNVKCKVKHTRRLRQRQKLHRQIISLVGTFPNENTNGLTNVLSLSERDT